MDNLITFKSCEKFELLDELKDFTSKLNGFNTDLLEESITGYLERLRDDIYFLLEYPYVDKVYRDTYYFYYSTKHGAINRNCIRISLFNQIIDQNDFFIPNNKDIIQYQFLGIMVLRPTYRSMIGRSMISPNAFKNHEFYSRTVETDFNIRGIKLKVCAFPHSSQDSETITCAETTIWGLMEYFGIQYPEYNPVLPSRIIQTLLKYTYERQTPSKGLTIAQISYALKELGFSTIIYHNDIFNDDFKKVLYYYIESGIPIIASVDMGKRGGHAVILSGHGKFNFQDVEKLPPSYEEELNGSGIKIIDTADLNKPIVVIDDNFPPYTYSDFEDPLKYWKEEGERYIFEFTSIVVPLYPKIYMEAYQARQAVLQILSKKYPRNNSEKELILRFFLTSSRSFKDKITQNKSLEEKVRKLVSIVTMPKFIWVGEISTKKIFTQKKKITGFVIIDATEMNPSKSLILAIFPKMGYLYDNDNHIREISLNLEPFDLYINNLTNYCNHA